MKYPTYSDSDFVQALNAGVDSALEAQLNRIRMQWIHKYVVYRLRFAVLIPLCILGLAFLAATRGHSDPLFTGQTDFWGILSLPEVVIFSVMWIVLRLGALGDGNRSNDLELLSHRVFEPIKSDLPGMLRNPISLTLQSFALAAASAVVSVHLVIWIGHKFSPSVEVMNFTGLSLYVLSTGLSFYAALAASMRTDKLRDQMRRIVPLANTEYCKPYDALVAANPDLDLLPPVPRELYVADYHHAQDLVDQHGVQIRDHEARQACVRLHVRMQSAMDANPTSALSSQA